MKINIIEPCAKDRKGSIGAFYVKYHAEKAGFKVDYLNSTNAKYDIEMISLHHCSDFIKLAQLPKKAKIRLVGGHPMQNNPRPIISFADAVFIGEAENSIGKSLNIIKQEGIKGLSKIPGWIISENWEYGKEIPKTIICDPLPDNPPYLNRPETLSRAWYVEIARGCPFKCYYCELGYSTKFRTYKYNQIKKVIDLCDLSKTKKINFYAPDEASHSDYKKLYQYLSGKGFLSAFSSMRLESVMKNNPPIKMNQLIRIGIDGLTEKIRFLVNKKITNKMIVDYFKMLLNNGHVNFKMFFIFGYPWEKLEDFNEFEKLMKQIFRLDMKKNVSLRIKWTPFIPQPCTPLRNKNAKYKWKMVDKIMVWHALNKRPKNEPGFFVENDGLMTAKSHKLQCDLTKGDERILYNFKKIERPLYEF
jgi:radical SAM superfamily enzyme YgiQ (UPF0313 family)